MKSGSNYSRRKFIGKAGTGAASLFVGTTILSACGGAKEKATEEVVETVAPEIIHKISAQLYTFRKNMGEDLAGTIEKVAGTGLKNVETFEFPPELREMAGYDANLLLLLRCLNKMA